MTRSMSFEQIFGYSTRCKRTPRAPRDMTCRAIGCDRQGRGLVIPFCEEHWRETWRHGRPLSGIKGIVAPIPVSVKPVKVKPDVRCHDVLSAFLEESIYVINVKRGRKPSLDYYDSGNQEDD